MWRWITSLIANLSPNMLTEFWPWRKQKGHADALVLLAKLMLLVLERRSVTGF